MNLDNVTVELRPRGQWEAAELGGRMVRRDAAAIYRVWFAITLPAIAVVLLITWFTTWGAVALLVYWWLEPLTDGPILRIVSRRLFGEEADVKATLRAFFRTALQTRLFWLTPYRFHFARSAMLPITQLEGLDGKKRRSRAATLGSRIFGHGLGLTAVYQHLVLAIYIGLILLVFFLLPESVRDSQGTAWLDMFVDGTSRWSAVLSLLCFYVAQSALHPWFVGAGFGLYINCRTQLEAWDIEVAFRRMVQRRATTDAQAGVAASMLACLLLGTLVLPATRVIAQQPASSSERLDQQSEEADPGFDGFWEDAEVDAAIQTVFAKPELTEFQTVDDWRQIQPADPDPEQSRGGMYRLLKWIGNVIAVIVEFALWIVAGLVLVAVFLSRKRWLPYLNAGPAVGKKRPRVMLAGGEVRSEDLPSDVPGTALRLWKSGEHRAALAMLYRGAVFALVTQYGIVLPKSATENMCVDAVARGASQQQSLLFRQIVLAWIQCAYASRLVDDDTVATLCRDWHGQYGAR